MTTTRETPTPTPTAAAAAAAAASCSRPSAWPKQRILFLLAGTFTFTGTALAATVSKWFAVVPAMVGANQLLMVATGWCPMSRLLDRVLPAAEARRIAQA